MSISKLVDDRPIKRKTKMACQKNKPKCMFYVNGGCCAEWCIFAELPDIITEGRTVTCSICNESKTTVSTYSGITDNYICPSCAEKIKKLIDNPTCDICGAKVEVGKSICSNCVSDIKNDLKDKPEGI